MVWEGQSVPHGTLDLIRKCNIECKGCYNDHPGFVKSVAEVKKDLDKLLDLRELDIVTLAGGEVTLHPNLLEIVEHVKARGLHVAIITNAVLLDEELAAKLRDAGADMILLHIQKDQERIDISSNATLDEIERLRSDKLELVAACGIETGICHIAYRNRMAEFRHVLSNFCDNPNARFALITAFSDFGKLGTLDGDIEQGFRQVAPGQHDKEHLEPKIKDLINIFQEKGINPFAYVGSSDGSGDKRWLIYHLCSIFNREGPALHYGLSSSLIERAAMRVLQLLPCRTPFMLRPSKNALIAHVFLNTIAGGSFRRNISLLTQALSRGALCCDKHILLQRAPECRKDGEVVFCEECPDATIRNGVLLPHCLVDLVVDGES